MRKPKILQEDQSYSFRSYFELPYEIDEILAELGYSFAITDLQLPTSPQPFDRVSTLQQQIQEILPYVSLSSETSRRETLVAPIVLELVRVVKCQLRIEYSVYYNNWLKGELDYFLWSENHLTVIEAKRDDLSRGFTQLAVELIAVSQVKEQAVVYGAVTIGEAWRFGKLDAKQHCITQDFNLYKVPGELHQLMAILVGILTQAEATS
jgi:hypothetical protein